VSDPGPLHRLVEESIARYPDRPAITEPGGRTLSYGELGRLAGRVRDSLVARGIRPGDRVGIHLPKSIDSVAAILGVLEAGAAYVPIDIGSPADRAAFILTDCEVRGAFVEQGAIERLAPALTAAGAEFDPWALPEPGGGVAIGSWVADADESLPAESPGHQSGPDDLAYLLYTSGSTGTPKGVAISHRAARSFVDWCRETFAPTPEDCFSSHAPFHFDLSIFDLYVALGSGARLVLLGEELGKEPLKLATTVAAERISIWYSTPSVLHLLTQYGRLERHDLSALRVVLFAGEVFPIPQLRALVAALPGRRYCNLYGPTETNVCTWYQLPPGPIDAGRTEPFPIGRACDHYRCRVVDENGETVPSGVEGELVAAGPGVMTGYWNLPERNERAFLVDDGGVRWYRTGDLVVEDEAGDYQFHGRRDRMIKRRGYRIELGEIEAGLAGHPAIEDVAVVARPDDSGATRVVAWLVARSAKPSIIDLKRFAIERLPAYMAPDAYRFVDRLPRTSTDKTDYQALIAQA